MQYVHDRPALYSTIISKLKERSQLIDRYIHRISSKMIKIGMKDRSYVKDESHNTANKRRSSCSVVAGYYSSTKSIKVMKDSDAMKSVVSSNKSKILMSFRSSKDMQSSHSHLQKYNDEESDRECEELAGGHS